MDWAADARRQVRDSLQDLNDAEAMLATLPRGSHDHVLMAEAVARLSAAAGQAVQNHAGRAALFDAAALSAAHADDYQSTYDGPARAEYQRVLGEFVADLGGRVEDVPRGLVAAFKGRRITIRFGPSSDR